MPKIITSSFVVPSKGAMPSVTGLLAPDGTLKRADNCVYSGVGRLTTRGGDRIALDETSGLVDENGAPVTTICAIAPFKDYALVVAWSSTTSKVYLYECDAEMTTAQLVTDTNAVDHLWSSVTTAPVVTIAEGLGVAYIATEDAYGTSTLDFPTKTWTPATDIINRLRADLDGDTVDEDVYFRGVVAFHQHLVGWGFDLGTTYTTAWRPEYLRFGGPNFTSLKSVDGGAAFGIGHNVRSARESVVGAKVAGDVLYVGTSYSLWAIVGYGRDTWTSHCLDASLGVASARSMVAVGDACFYWSPNGPMRVTGVSEPEPLWDPIADAVEACANPQSVIGISDTEGGRVCFIYGDSDTDAAPRQMVSFDVRREAWTGPQSTVGANVFTLATVTPVPGATAPLPGPVGSPSNAHVSLGPSDVWCQVGITAGDTHPETVTHFEIRKVGDTGWTAFGTVPATQQGFTFRPLIPSTQYEWRCWHTRNGINSSDLGPDTSTLFTTTA